MKINERIENDSVFICEFSLCQLRLLKDELDWFLLIPKREGITEIIDLNDADQETLMKEISQVSKILRNNSNFDKLNIGSLGNIVSQLHIHIIGRKEIDRAWPNSIWGSKTIKPFNTEKVKFWRNCIH